MQIISHNIVLCIIKIANLWMRKNWPEEARKPQIMNHLASGDDDESKEGIGTNVNNQFLKDHMHTKTLL